MTATNKMNAILKSSVTKPRIGLNRVGLNGVRVNRFGLNGVGVNVKLAQYLSLSMGILLYANVACAAQPAVQTLVPEQHFPYGFVLKKPLAPAVTMTMQDSKTYTLPELLNGKVTAVQLIFTGCTATCPIQGALFAEVAKKVNNTNIQLISISFDPLHDDPKALQKWMSHFNLYKFWLAGVLKLSDVDVLFDFLGAKADNVDSHVAQVYFFDRTGRLVYKTNEFPTAKSIANQLNQLSAMGI